MVGIVIVSHSFRIAEGVAELAREMGGPDVRLETAGGLDLPEHPVGTDAVLVMQAIDRAWSEDGVLVLMDLGSAVLSAEMALDLMDEDRRALVQLCEAPLVEGAVAAAVTAKLGADLDGVAKEAREGLAGKLAHLGAPPQVQSEMETARAAGPVASTELTVELTHGLHARPAARFVQTASAFDADVNVRNMTTGRGPADATSLNGVAMLAVTSGHRIEITATGPQAQEAIAALERLAARRFDEPGGSGGEPIGEPVPGVRAATKGVLTGHPASPGIAIGAARRPHVGVVMVPEGDAEDPASELRALDRGVADASDDLRRQREDVAARAGDAEAEIFDAHLLFLQDEALLAPTRRAIEADGRTAAQAWQGVIDATAQLWDALDDEYLRARAADLRSVGTQVLAHLVGVEPPSPRLEAPGILVTADLAPADTVSLDPSLVVGIATARGGPTSHAAVLARALGIPAVVGLGDLLLEVAEGTPLVLDGERGEVIVSPSAEQGQQARAAMEMRAVELTRAHDAALAAAVTLDGTPIEIGANVGRPGEVAAAVEGGADSVGLFRTEVLFMSRDRMPDEDEQVEAYRAAAVALAGRPLTIRTLDAGADKPISYLSQPHEDNPFLGVRGIRLGLDRPSLLETQCRAIARVGADHPVRVMFPMVATLHELRAARAIFERAREDLGTQRQIEVGVMIEVPAAALLTGTLAAEVDFFSIGTNDLTQYVMAADRGNDRVASLSDPLHPAVLRLIGSTVEGAVAHDRWVGVCGELAADPTATPVLLGLGVRELSMSTPAIGLVKEAVRRIDLAAARSLAARALACPDAGEVRALLSDHMDP